VSDIVLGAAGRHIPEKKNLNRNISKNNTTKKY